MSNFYQVLLRGSQILDNGSQGNVTENVLVDALSYTEAEALVLERVERNETEFMDTPAIIRVTKTTISECFGDEDDSFDDNENYKVKASFQSIDENAGKAKLITHYQLINARDVDDALERLKEQYKSFTVPYEIEAITKTRIVNVFLYNK